MQNLLLRKHCIALHCIQWTCKQYMCSAATSFLLTNKCIFTLKKWCFKHKHSIQAFSILMKCQLCPAKLFPGLQHLTAEWAHVGANETRKRSSLQDLAMLGETKLEPSSQEWKWANELMEAVGFVFKVTRKRYSQNHETLSSVIFSLAISDIHVNSWVIIGNWE